MIEHDPPVMSYSQAVAFREAMDAELGRTNSVAIEGGMIADQLARLKAENARQFLRIVFLEAALETALSPEYIEQASTSARLSEKYDVTELLSHTLRLPSTPGPYGR